MDIASLKVDSAVIAEGTWVSDIPEMGDLKLRVRGWSSPKAKHLLSRKLRAVPKKQRGRDGLPLPKVEDQITAEVLHEAVLLDWSGMTDAGKPLPYDPKLAGEWLSNPDYRPFRDAVSWAARAVDNDEAEATEDLAGN